MPAELRIPKNAPVWIARVRAAGTRAPEAAPAEAVTEEGYIAMPDESGWEQCGHAFYQEEDRSWTVRLATQTKALRFPADSAAGANDCRPAGGAATWRRLPQTSSAWLEKTSSFDSLLGRRIAARVEGGLWIAGTVVAGHPRLRLIKIFFDVYKRYPAATVAIDEFCRSGAYELLHVPNASGRFEVRHCGSCRQFCELCGPDDAEAIVLRTASCATKNRRKRVTPSSQEKLRQSKRVRKFNEHELQQSKWGDQ